MGGGAIRIYKIDSERKAKEEINNVLDEAIQSVLKIANSARQNEILNIDSLKEVLTAVGNTRLTLTNCKYIIEK